MNDGEGLEMIAPETSCCIMPVKDVIIAAFYSRGGPIKFACHRLCPLLPMSKLIACEGGTEGMIELPQGYQCFSAQSVERLPKNCSLASGKSQAL